MNPLVRTAFSLMLLIALAFAAAREHRDVDVVDLVRVDRDSGQLTLCALLEEPLDNRPAVDRLRRKLNLYARYARSGFAVADEPRANPDLAPILEVIAFAPISTIARQNLDGIRLQYRYTDVHFKIEIVDPGAVMSEPRRIEMHRRASLTTPVS